MHIQRFVSLIHFILNVYPSSEEVGLIAKHVVTNLTELTYMDFIVSILEILNVETVHDALTLHVV